MTCVVEEGKTARTVARQGWDERIEVVECDKMVRAFIVRSQRHTFVIDTLLGPISGAFLREQALRPGHAPLIVVNSHADWDHYWGNQVFPEPIVGSQAAQERIRVTCGPKELEKKRKDCATSYAALELVAPSLGMAGAGSLDGGDLTLQLLPTPGHRHDHLAVWIPEIRTLFPGDTVEDPIPLLDDSGRPDLLATFEATLEQLIALQPDWVFPCHAEPHRGTGLIESNLAYLRKLRSEASRASSLEQLKSDFPFPGAADMEFYPAEHVRGLELAWKETR